MSLGSDSETRGAGRTILAVLIAFALITFASNRSGPLEEGELRAEVEDGAAPVLTYLSMPFRGIETFFEDRRERSLAFEENRELKSELRRLQDVERQKRDLERKLAAVRQHTFLPPIDEHRIVIARAVAETGGPFASTALVNAGASQGVRAGSAVMSTQGLYGHVLRVGDGSSRVLRVVDPSSRIAVKSDRSDARAILTGSNTGRPTLRFVDKEDDFLPGDPVLTSGDEGVLPGDLLVGVVDEDGNVRPAETGRTADWIRIYVREPIAAPSGVEDGVVVRVVPVPVEPDEDAETGAEGEGDVPADGPAGG